MKLLKNPVDRIWLALLLATAITFAVGETGAIRSGLGPVLLIFGLSGLKGAWIALDFMELRHAPRLWRRLIIGWLVVVLALIVGAWWLALAPAGSL